MRYAQIGPVPKCGGTATGGPGVVPRSRAQKHPVEVHVGSGVLLSLAVHLKEAQRCVHMGKVCAGLLQPILKVSDPALYLVALGAEG